MNNLNIYCLDIFDNDYEKIKIWDTPLSVLGKETSNSWLRITLAKIYHIRIVHTVNILFIIGFGKIKLMK